MYNDELIESSKIKWQSFLKGDDDAYAWLYSGMFSNSISTDAVLRRIQRWWKIVFKMFLWMFIGKRIRYSSPPDNVKIYLMSSLRNSIFNVFNKGNLHDTYISNINYEFDLSVEEKLIETEDETSQKHTVAHLLNTLSPRQREIIYYRFFEGLDYSCHLWIDGA